MGSLALAVAGGIGGAGAGVADVARQDLLRNREETLMRLRAQEQERQQQTGIAAQKSLQASGQQFEAGQEQIKLGAASRAHGATLAQEKQLKEEQLASEERRTTTTGKYRLASAQVRASAMQSGKGNAPLWELHNINVGQPLGPDGKPNLTAAPIQKAVLFNKQTGAAYIQMGGRLYRYDADKNAPVVDPKSTNRAVDPGEVQDLLTDPMGTIPVGPNAGMSKADAFERAHGFLPGEFQGALNRAQAAQNQSRSGVSLSLPAGLVHSIGGPNATSNKVNEYAPAQEAQDTADEAREDSEDAQDNAAANEPSGPSQADSDFANISNQ